MKGKSVIELQKDIEAVWSFLEENSSVGHICQSYEWSRVVKDSLGMGARFYVVEARGELVGGFLLTETKFIIHPLLYGKIRGGPLCLPGFEGYVAEQVAGYAKERNGYVFTVVHPSPVFSDLFGRFGLKIRSPRLCTFLIDPTQPEEVLWKNLNKRARWGVRKAKRVGVEIVEADTLRRWQAYYQIHKAHSQAHSLPCYPWQFYEQAFKRLHPKRMAQIFLSYLDDQPIAGSMFLIHRRYMCFYQNVSLDKYLKNEPNNLIQWQSVLWAKENGVKAYDMEGILCRPPKVSSSYWIHKYKEKWGGRKVRNDHYYGGMLYGTISRLYFAHERNIMQRRLFSFLRNRGIV